jgi:hypothetical protein
MCRSCRLAVSAGRPDALRGYTTIMTEITAPNVVATSGLKFLPMVVHTGNPANEVPGTLFSVTKAELGAAEKHAVSDHKRVEVVLKWESAWVYVKA